MICALDLEFELRLGQARRYELMYVLISDISWGTCAQTSYISRISTVGTCLTWRQTNDDFKGRRLISNFWENL